MRHLKLVYADSGIVSLIMDNADETMNLVSDAFIAEMMDATAQIAADDSIKGVILTSGKPAFMAGADLKLLVQGYSTLTLKDAYAFSQKASAMHRAMETSGKPWVAVMNGLALGGGFELALACHYRILVDDSRAIVGLPEVNVGLLPGSGGTQRLIRIAGVKTATDLLLSGRPVKGAEAIKLKIIDAVVPADQLESAARAWLATGPSAVKPWDVKGYAMPEARGLIVPDYSAGMMFATGSIVKAGYNLPAPVAILSCIYEGSILPFDKALKVESRYFAKLLTSPVSRNIIRTTFLSKGAAERGARRPMGIAKSEFKKVGVLGAGMMGAGIALVSAQSGCDIILIDRDEATATRGKAYSETVFAKQIARGTMTREKADAILAKITPSNDFALLEGCDLIIEAVFEDAGIKAETTRKAEAVIPLTTVYASNTSTLPISKLAEASSRPEQFIGLHFFSPVDRMGLVEIIKGEKTSPATLAVALDFVKKLRKTPIVVNDSRGFYTSRVFQTFIHEGAAMMAEGVPPAVIENAAKAVGMPVGPLALLDELTFDLPLKIVDQALEQDGDKYVLPAGVAVLRKMKASGRSGKKEGAGFYDYPAEGGKHLWKGLADIFPVAADYDVDLLKQRFLYAQAIETARCHEENVIETSEDGDLGAVYGWGFPAWTGGTLSYIDTVGIATFVRECDRLAQLYGPRFSPSPRLRERAAKGQGFY
jgi:3-hydroxyacyl-CoA dehydrogenase / enoyl-CoA hydratase / 3-hydroxybutyryl-CoA epimerase